MMASGFVYAGAVLVLFGLICSVKPLERLRVRTRRRGLAIAAAGAVMAALALLSPPFESHVTALTTRHDEFARAWQFHEVHTRRVAAPPDRVYEAIKNVRADEILLFRTLTWMRRGGRAAPPSILNADNRPLIEVATAGGFILLADDAPRELVLGTVVVAPRGGRPPLEPALFRAPAAADLALATLNFHVTPDGNGGSIVSTETRVDAGARARRVFGAYWRVIYPGSALIRRMWLRAIARRATSNDSVTATSWWSASPAASDRTIRGSAPSHP